jgi:hypothetical protein
VIDDKELTEESSELDESDSSSFLLLDGSGLAVGAVW